MNCPIEVPDEMAPVTKIPGVLKKPSNPPTPKTGQTNPPRVRFGPQECVGNRRSKFQVEQAMWNEAGRGTYVARPQTISQPIAVV